jgi:hypothetical protein
VAVSSASVSASSGRNTASTRSAGAYCGTISSVCDGRYPVIAGAPSHSAAASTTENTITGSNPVCRQAPSRSARPVARSRAGQ